MQITRHVGKITNTGIRVVVVFRKMPDDSEHCLIVESDRLPDAYHDNLMTILSSKEGQSTVDLYTVLHRRKFADGENCLTALHQKNFMKKMKIDDITLFPSPNYPLTLRNANNDIDGTTTAPSTTATAQTNLPEVGDEAGNLLVQAQLMEDDATSLRERAYTLDPSLRPRKGRPSKTPEEKEKAKLERKAKKALDKLAEADAKKDEKLAQAVSDKIARDQNRIDTK